MYNEIKPKNLCGNIEKIKKDIFNDKKVKFIIDIKEKTFQLNNGEVVKGFLVKEALFYRKKIRESFYWKMIDEKKIEHCYKSYMHPGKEITSEDIEKNIKFLKQFF